MEPRCAGNPSSPDLDDLKELALIDALFPEERGDGQHPSQIRRHSSGITCTEVSEEAVERALEDNFSLLSSSIGTTTRDKDEAAIGVVDTSRRRRTSQVCIHGRVKGTCKQCGGKRICIHGRQKAQCRECKAAGVPGAGSQICEHDKRRSVCKICQGSEICSHVNRRISCKICKNAASEGTCVEIVDGKAKKTK